MGAGGVCLDKNALENHLAEEAAGDVRGQAAGAEDITDPAGCLRTIGLDMVEDRRRMLCLWEVLAAAATELASTEHAFVTLAGLRTIVRRTIFRPF